jgi:hypothetical protein
MTRPIAIAATIVALGVAGGAGGYLLARRDAQQTVVASRGVVAARRARLPAIDLPRALSISALPRPRSRHRRHAAKPVVAATSPVAAATGAATGTAAPAVTPTPTPAPSRPAHHSSGGSGSGGEIVVAPPR